MRSRLFQTGHLRDRSKIRKQTFSISTIFIFHPLPVTLIHTAYHRDVLPIRGDCSRNDRAKCDRVPHHQRRSRTSAEYSTTTITVRLGFSAVTISQRSASPRESALVRSPPYYRVNIDRQIMWFGVRQPAAAQSSSDRSDGTSVHRA